MCCFFGKLVCQEQTWGDLVGPAWLGDGGGEMSAICTSYPDQKKGKKGCLNWLLNVMLGSKHCYSVIYTGDLMLV